MTSISINYKTDFFTGGCNCNHYSITWSEDDEIAYATQKYIVILSLKFQSVPIYDYYIQDLQNEIIFLKFYKYQDMNLLVSVNGSNIINVYRKENNEYILFRSGSINHKFIPEIDLVSGEFYVYCGSDNLYLQIFSISDKNFIPTSLKLNSLAEDFPLCARTLLIAGHVHVIYGGTCGFLHIKSCKYPDSPVLRLKAHNDWIKAISCTHINGYDYIATASQDHSVCIWRVEEASKSTEKPRLMDSLTRHKITLNHDENVIEYHISKDSILAAHSAAVSRVEWLPSGGAGKTLVTLGMDELAIIWEYDPINTIWNDKVRFGSFNEIKYGYMSLAFHSDRFMISSRDRSLHYFSWCSIQKSYVERYVLSGNSEDVQCIAVEPSGSAIFCTCSSDMSVRIYGLVKFEDKMIWTEIARPFLHGHPLASVCMLNIHTIISASSEKIIRVHEGTDTYLRTLQKFSITDPFLDNFKNPSSHGMLQTLDLTQIPCYDEQEIINAQKYNENNCICNLKTDLLSDHFLRKYSLWIETKNLHGHGNNVILLSINGPRSILASTSEARKFEDAYIGLWDTKTWRLTQKLYGHKSRISKMEFSYDDEYLLSVSNDRTFIIFQRHPSNPQEYQLKFHGQEYVKRGFKCLAWTSDDHNFTLISRDKKVIMFDADTLINGCNDPLISFSTKNEPLYICHCLTTKRDVCTSYIFSISTVANELLFYMFLIENNATSFIPLEFNYSSICDPICVTKINARNDADFTLIIASYETLRIINFYVNNIKS